MEFIRLRKTQYAPEVEGIVEEGPEVYEVARRVASGLVSVPAWDIDGEYAINHEDGPRYGDVGYTTKAEFRRLLAEVLGVRTPSYEIIPTAPADWGAYSGLYSRGLYLSVIDIVKDEKPMVQTSAAYVRDRMFSAAWEGLMHGVATWQADKVSGGDPLLAYMKHVHFWAQRYARHEAVALRGEALGMLREAELSQKEFFRGSYSRLRSAAWAYGEAWCIECRNPSVADILGVLEENGKRVARKQVEGYVSEKYGANCVEDSTQMQGELKEDIIAVHRAVRGDVPELMGSLPAFTQDDLDAFDLLSQLRDQLLTALAAPLSWATRLTPLVAEIVDVMFFSALALEDTPYTESVTGLCDAVKLRAMKSERLCSDDERWRERVEARVQALRASGGDVYVTVPELSPRGSSPSVKSGVSAPRLCCGAVDSDAFQHLGIRGRSLSSRVALRVAARHATPPGPENIDVADYDEILKKVQAVRRLIRDCGYLNPHRKEALPVIREMHYLEAGWSLAAQYTPDRELLYVKLNSGRRVPMMVWVPPDKVRKRSKVTSRGHTRVDVGAELERLRTSIELERQQEALVKAGRMEVRPVLVRCMARDGTESTTKKRRTQWKVTETIRWYKRVERVLPTSNTIGKIRVLGSQLPKMGRGALRGFMGDTLLVVKRRTPQVCGEGETKVNQAQSAPVDTRYRGSYASYNAEDSNIRISNDTVRLVATLFDGVVDSTGLISGLELPEFAQRIACALRGAPRAAIRSNTIRTI